MGTDRFYIFFVTTTEEQFRKGRRHYCTLFIPLKFDRFAQPHNFLAHYELAVLYQQRLNINHVCEFRCNV